MKETLHSSDGSQYYGNGVWGPSSIDLQRADLSFNEKPKREEDPDNHLLFVSRESMVGRLLQTISKVKPPAKLAIPGSMATVFLMGACSGGEKNTQEFENKEAGYTLPFPKGETWFLTGGPHADGLSNDVRYAIDIAPPEVRKCPTDGSKLVIDNRMVTASASGQVILAGDDKNRNDPSHSMVKIKDANGLTEVYIHLTNTKVKKGDNVSQGAPLGNPSCEYPPGGRTEGAHVHEGLEKDGQAIPIDGVIVGGWTIRNGSKNYNGTMTRTGEKTRTADVRRCKTDTDCGGIRNDLPNNLPNKAVIAEPKDPIPPISGKVNEKSISTTPTEKPQPTPNLTQKIEVNPFEKDPKVFATNYFLSFLDRTQRGKAYAERLGYSNQADEILESKLTKTGNDSYKIRWTHTRESGYHSDFGYLFQKNIGEAEIKEIATQVTPSNLSRSDKANGVEWAGNVSINFLMRQRFMIPVVQDAYGATENRWSELDISIPPNLAFSPWSESAFGINLAKINGKMQVLQEEYLKDGSTNFIYPLGDAYYVMKAFSSHFGLASYDVCTVDAFGTKTKIPGCMQKNVSLRP